MALAGALPAVQRAAVETKAALFGSLAFSAALLSQGLLSFAALGADGPALGLRAAFISVVLGGLVFALLSRSPVPAAGPGSATTLIFSSLVLHVVLQPGFSLTQAGNLLQLLAITSAAVVGMGVLQIVWALLGLGRLVHFVPQPVLAGYMNGVSVLIVLTQLPLLLGWRTGTWRDLFGTAWLQTQPGAVLLALVTLAAIWFGPRLAHFLRSKTPTMLGLLAGTLTAVLLHFAWPSLPLGPTLGQLPMSPPDLASLSPWFGHGAVEMFRQHGSFVASTALVLATIGSLESALNSLAMGQLAGAPVDPRHELLSCGASNLASGALGGLPVVLLRTRAMPTWQAGGRTRWSCVLGCLLLAAVATLGLPWLSELPKAILAAVMVALAVALFDSWSRGGALLWWRGMRSGELRLNLSVVAIVCAATVLQGLLTGLAVGLLLAMLLFIRSMNRSLVRGRHSGTATPSRRVYAAVQEAFLSAARERIVVLELEGALFFGSAERLMRECRTLRAGTHTLVLDFKRVSTVDASGSVQLQALTQQLAQRNMVVRLAGVSPGNRHALALQALSGNALVDIAQWHADTDHAMEAAEQALLRSAGLADVANQCSLGDSALCLGMSDAHKATLSALMPLHSLVTGERLFAEGDAADRLFVAASGSVTLYSTITSDEQQRQRYLSVSAGMIFGEAAMLDGHGRSASAVADVAGGVYVLTQETLQSLRDQQPALTTQLMHNLALHLAQRLRAAGSVWQARAR